MGHLRQWLSQHAESICYIEVKEYTKLLAEIEVFKGCLRLTIMTIIVVQL